MNAPLPTWLSLNPDVNLEQAPSNREFLEGRYEVSFRRILEMVAEGYSLKNALREYPIEFNHGAYRTWIYRDPNRRKEYNLAKLVRADADVDKAMDHAESINNPLEDVNRSKLIVDALKWRAAHDDRETYGDTKRVEVAHSISILQALEDGQKRLEQLPLLPSHSIEQIDTPEDTEDDAA